MKQIRDLLMAAAAVAALGAPANAASLDATLTELAPSAPVTALAGLGPSDELFRIPYSITNNTGVTWQSFRLRAEFGSFFETADFPFEGPAGSFALFSTDISTAIGVMDIGGISIADGEVLNFTTDLQRGGGPQDFILFYAEASADAIENPNPNPIPLPAAAWLLLGGLGALGALARRRAA
ncbi:VPLPA-CTERM sorting domain-containing protein [Rubrimonas cliftonensis]|uniref:VPLPA-CTERM protein sorting domain-containing protein n=1 Tax=Rubrimonas cliftonensis TaxID=89524 RepID=A0A1H4FP89_9RHOB|nr:VPLPA-CTERM sorting domain-containing protein [Rubrimonas cliftonensis]SEA99136.1 VPLPA-CTERM protein sorting domain-containing protein [Rubrimonas cliftonensis]